MNEDMTQPDVIDSLRCSDNKNSGIISFWKYVMQGYSRTVSQQYRTMRMPSYERSVWVIKYFMLKTFKIFNP